MRSKLFLVVLLSMFAVPVWAINKCTAPDGRVSYQEAKCADDARVATIKAPATPSGATSLDDRIKSAAEKCGFAKLPEYPEIGWSEERFLSCSVAALYGGIKINSTETAFGVSKQYVLSNYKAYVYVRGGKVVTIQR